MTALGGKPNPRSKHWSFVFHPCSEGEDPGPYRSRSIPVNGPPVEIENAHFKGSMMLVHDTGNEPGAIAKTDGSERLGVQFQIQGKFKHGIERGPETSHGLWVGGELPQPLNLGWIMQKIVSVCMTFARKKCEGRIQSSFGAVPHVSFPIGQLFTVVRTAPGAPVPPIGGKELRETKWQGPGWIDIDTEATYTMIYKTPYLDVCSWDLLKVPGVSPLGLETILGDQSDCTMCVFDQGLVETCSDWRKGAFLQWSFSRGSPGDTWAESDDAADPAPKAARPGAEAMPENDDLASENSDCIDEDAVVAVEDAVPEDAMSESSGSSSGGESDALESVAESQVLFEIEGWRPRPVNQLETTRARVPFYIEAIDRRRKSKMRTWYVISMTDAEGGSEFWHAKAASELAGLCRPRRRLNTFWRGSGTRMYTCCAVKTLERFRHVIRHHLASDTELRAVVLAAAAQEEQDGSNCDCSDEGSPRRMTPAGIARTAARKVRKGTRGLRGPLLPPRFFVGSGRTCALAFAHAREGRSSVVRETLVGAIHFEGRLCEELLRLSSDGTIRCFAPYDCDRPRLRLKSSDLLHVQAMDGLFAGRFHLWQVHTVLKVFVFCSNDEQDCAEWVAAVRAAIDEAKATASAQASAAADVEFNSEKALASGDATPSPESKLMILGDRFGTGNFMQKVNTTLHNKLASVSLALRVSLTLNEPQLSDLSTLLTDDTRARRWRQTRRLVLNDRLLLAETLPPGPSFAEELLETALKLVGQTSSPQDMIAFSNSLCKLKAVRFKSWTHNELLAFWLNIYHCMLLHSWILMGKPNNPQELNQFHVRMSYLVGLRPVSLREIERVILRIPQVDQKTTVKAHAGARAQQLMGLFGMFGRWRRAPPSEEQPRSPGGTLSPQPSTLSHISAESSLALRRQPPPSAFGRCLPVPMPMMAIPRVTSPWQRMTGHHACLFLGKEPEDFVLPQQDTRCVLCLNRGSGSSLAEVPVFHANCLSSELDDVSRRFVQHFVRPHMKDGRLIRVDVPESCKSLEQDLSLDPKVVLGFLWKFMPAGSAALQPSTKLKFCKGNDEPRMRSELTKLVYTDNNLRSDHFAGLPRVGAEFDAIAGTARQLAKLASSRSLAPGGAHDEAHVAALDANPVTRIAL